MKALSKAFGDTVRQCRQRASVSQEELAFRAGVHRTYISQLERGLKGPSLRMVFALAAALDVDPTDLVRLVQDRVHGKRRSS
jgi:transcriptional regulator with XRE-family HTH domain